MPGDGIITNYYAYGFYDWFVVLDCGHIKMWELQRDMHSWVAPSIFKTYKEEDRKWLNQRYADQRWDEDTGDKGYKKLEQKANQFSLDVLIEEIANNAIEFGSTTNGGHEVYLDDYTSIPWCFETEVLTWYS